MIHGVIELEYTADWSNFNTNRMEIVEAATTGRRVRRLNAHDTQPLKLEFGYNNATISIN